VSYQTLSSPRPQLNQRPATPTVPIDRVRSPSPTTTQELQQIRDEIADMRDVYRRQINEIRAELIDLRLKFHKRGANGITLRAAKLTQEAANRHNVTYEQIMGGRRCQHISAARKEAYALVATQCPEWSWNDIGRFFHRDHTTVLKTLQKMGVVRG
jgi:chromosomal replication initiation ATPase DnaA